MLIGREQDGVDGAESIGAERRALGLRECALADRIAARRIEGRVGQHAQPADLQDRRRAA
jgi:hypothetical protein